ncbi:hypothetical protein H9Q72_000629 [Fusarium xylarioides]|uniref:Uncharacterized protein n=1 Tax=Fusarium xylarioides TaxID=221167 RepID=A0A9P7IK76_9HYPO|nr:hypothetical protein H9Q70_007679 [Fusarium xylarioides]KAG5773759.1 hypothetical protein H9Q72_000629 [Fusarium xylarioides]KAG5804336.1 hypothetical protein H9Q71_011092 [Fusarium xylarioides]KAG5814461.1 hypothetical protein H9Q74_012238 [Fusarium xylarioides]
MSQRLKAQVKRSARNKRARQMIQRITQTIQDQEPPVKAPIALPALTPGPPSPTPLVSDSADNATPASWPSSVDIVTSSNSENVAPDSGIALDPLFSETSEKCLFGSNFRESLNVNLYGEEDLRFLTAYKDYVFPLLHPFYHPSFFEGGHN